MKQIRLDDSVHEVLRDYAVQEGRSVKWLASAAVAEFLQRQGIEVVYPRPKTERPKQAA